MTNYNEFVDGDLSSDYLSPTPITLSTGSNIIRGNTTGNGNPPDDPDFFTFTVPTNQTITSIRLNDYWWFNPDSDTATYGNSYFALTTGNAFPSITDGSTFLISKLIDDRSRSSLAAPDLLEPGVGNALGGAGSGSLGSGTYSIWYQETAANTIYEFDIKLELSGFLPPPPPTPRVFKYEAEDLDLNTYLIEDNEFASGDQLISLKFAAGTEGTASTDFTGAAGNYHVIVRYVDEIDGEATLDFRVNGGSIDAWTLDKALDSFGASEQAFTERVIENVALSPGDTLSIRGNKQGDEETRVDSIQLVPSDQFIQIEAEDMLLGTYRVEENEFASGDELISLRNAFGITGTASTNFSGPDGTYDITVGYVDETDGEANLVFKVDGVTQDSWTLNKDLGDSDPLEQTFIEREIMGVSLNAGSELSIMGTLNGFEWARVDFIRILPTDS